MHTQIQIGHLGRTPNFSLARELPRTLSPQVSGPMQLRGTKMSWSWCKQGKKSESCVELQLFKLMMVMVQMHCPWSPKAPRRQRGARVEGRRMPEQMEEGHGTPQPLPFGSDSMRSGALADASGSHSGSIFPLPFFACPAKKVGCSRGVRQRRNRIRRVIENKNEVIFALNWMAGAHHLGIDDVSPSSLVDNVVQRVDGLVEDQKPSGCVMGEEESLKAILKGGSPYDMATVNDSLASYQPELVSVPADIRGCPDLSTLLPPSDRHFLEEKTELMIKPEGERVDTSLTQPYWDPKLRYNRKSYHELVRKLHSIGYFTYTRSPACKVGAFFVWKSNRTKLRMITDARQSNSCFNDPPGVNLMTGEGLGKIEVVFDDGAMPDHEMLDALTVFIGLSDVRDCFHRMRVPGWLARYFAWEPVAAHVVGLTGLELEGKTLVFNDVVWPCAGSLCQGFSWSLFFAQRANEFLSGNVSPLQDCRLANDRGGPIILKVGKDVHSSPYHYVYVDNLGVIDTDRDRVSLAMSGLQSVFNSLGLELHATEISETYVEALGCVLEGDKMRSRTNPKRLWRVHHAIKALLRRGRCTGRTLEVLIGHCTFIGLMRRGSLAIFHSVYSFIHKHYKQVASLWSSVKLELRSFMGIIFMLVQDWWRPWNSAVTSSDSSLSGYGVSQAWWPKSVVSRVGRLQERSRFKRCGSHAARESALSSAGFHYDGQSWGPFNPDAAKRIAEAGWEFDRSFEEVPAFGLKREHWMPKLWGRWNFKESIGILEARAVLKAVKRLCLSSFGHDIRHVHLCDNLGVVLSVERSRSKNYKLLKVIRQINAFLFARNIHLAIRWIPSELNFSDEPSRVFDDEDSKLLIDLIQLDDFCGVSSQAPKQQQHAAAPCASIEPVLTPADAKTQEGSSFEKSIVETAGGREPSGAEASCLSDTATGERRISGEKIAGQAHQTFEIGRCSRLGASCSAPFPDRGDRRDERQWKHFIRMEGRKRRKEASLLPKQAKRQFAEFGQFRYAPGQARPKPSGNGQCEQACPRELRQEVARAGKLGEVEEGFIHEPWSSRPVACRPLQHQVLGGRRQSLWGLYDGLADGQEARVWQVGSLEAPTSLEKYQRLEKAMPISLEACLPVSSVVRAGMEDGGLGTHAESSFLYDPAIHLSPSWCTSETSQNGTCTSHGWSYQFLEHCDQSYRDIRCFQDGQQGRLNPPGLEVAAVPLSGAQGAEQGAKDGSSLGLQLCGVPHSVPSSLRRPEGRAHCPLSGQALRTIDRQGFKGQRHGGGSKARAMDDKNQRPALREGRQTGSDMASSGSQCSDGMQVGGKISRGDHPRPRLSGHHSSRIATKRGYFADFFAGSGGVSRAVRKLGFTSREWELLHGENHDLTKPSVLRKIHSDIKHGKILAAMFGPPCLTFSPARDRTSVIRNKQFPWGLPQLSQRDAEKVAVGNACFRSAFKIIRWLDKYKIPWMLENPHSSKAWYLPELVELQNAEHTCVFYTDFCQYKTRWRKRTRLLSGNLDWHDVARCQRVCHGSSGICSRSGQPHFHLTGSNPKGIPWTQVAQPYPVGLCHDLAYALLAPLRVIPWKATADNKRTQTPPVPLWTFNVSGMDELQSLSVFGLASYWHEWFGIDQCVLKTALMVRSQLVWLISTFDPFGWSLLRRAGATCRKRPQNRSACHWSVKHMIGMSSCGMSLIQEISALPGPPSPLGDRPVLFKDSTDGEISACLADFHVWSFWLIFAKTCWCNV